MARVRPGMTQPRQKANAGDHWQLGNRKIKTDTLSHACIQRMQISLPQGQRHMLGREVCTLRGPGLCLYFFIFSFFSTFSQNWTKLSNIWQNWAKLRFHFFAFPASFLIDFNNLEKNWGDCGHNWNKLGAFGQNSANLRQIGGAFGQNWATLRKIGGLLGRIGRKIGAPFTFVLRHFFFPIAHQAQLHIELQNAYPAGRCLI